MGKVLAFSHPPKVGHWSKVKMNNGDPCWISIGKESVIIKILLAYLKAVL